jgi:hypothetical protein
MLSGKMKGETQQGNSSRHGTGACRVAPRRSSFVTAVGNYCGGQIMEEQDGADKQTDIDAEGRQA